MTKVTRSKKAVRCRECGERIRVPTDGTPVSEAVSRHYARRHKPTYDRAVARQAG